MIASYPDILRCQQQAQTKALIQPMSTSPDLPNLIVAGDTPDEVLGLAPQVASALIASMKAHGDKLPATLRPVQSLPFTSQAAVVA